MTGNTLSPFSALNKSFLKWGYFIRFTRVLVHSTPKTYTSSKGHRSSKLDTKPYLSIIDFVAILAYVKLETHCHQSFNTPKPHIKCKNQIPKTGYKPNRIETRRIKYLLGPTESSC